eukprot:3940724-Rhodomonas_salina.3
MLLHARYAMSGTDLACGAIRAWKSTGLCWRGKKPSRVGTLRYWPTVCCYAMSGTGLPYAATPYRVLTQGIAVLLQPACRCPVLTSRMLLRHV